MNRTNPGRRRRLLALAWTAALIAVAVRQIGCRLSCDDDRSWFWKPVRDNLQSVLPFELPERVPPEWPADAQPRRDNNTAHIQIDFGGQWVQGRMLAAGHGRRLYDRHVQRGVVEAAYPVSDQSPTQKTRDADDLLNVFMGSEHPGWSRAICLGLAGMADDWPARFACFAEAGRQRDAAEAAPREIDAGLGGPLYPPLQAFFFLPYGLFDRPLRAYFTHQYFLMGCLLLAARGIARFGGGEIAWPVAIVLLVTFGGMKANFELGQNGPLTLVVLVWGWVYRCGARPVLGGAVWGLLAYKPVWAMSYFFALVLLREFRMAGAMAGTGILLGLMTLPFVGLHSWFDWLKVGGAASELYAVDSAWVPLSRDLFGLPRRLLLDFRTPYEQRFTLAAHLAGWMLWMLVLELTLRVFFAGGRSAYREPFVLLAAWLLTYHFIYYDAAVAAFPFFALLAVDRRVRRDRGMPTPWFGFLGWCYSAMAFSEYVLHPLGVKATFLAARYSHGVPEPGGAVTLYPRLLIEFDEGLPWDTLVLIAVWGWCALKVLREPGGTSEMTSLTLQARTSPSQ